MCVVFAKNSDLQTHRGLDPLQHLQGLRLQFPCRVCSCSPMLPSLYQPSVWKIVPKAWLSVANIQLQTVLIWMQSTSSPVLVTPFAPPALLLNQKFRWSIVHAWNSIPTHRDHGTVVAKRDDRPTSSSFEDTLVNTLFRRRSPVAII